MQYDLILTLYAAKRLKPTVKTLRMLAAIQRPRQIVCVVTGREIAPDAARRLIAPCSDAVHIVEHDNTGREFGAYQAGLDHLAGRDLDRLMILNDTVGSHQPVSRHYLEKLFDKLRPPLPCGLAVGTINYSERALTLDGLTSSRWLRSNLMGFDEIALSKLGNRILAPKIELLITDTHDISRFFGAEIGPTMQEHLSQWLFSKTGSYYWYGAEPLSVENAGRMAGKARSILQEKYLTFRLDASDVAIRGMSMPVLMDALLNRISRLKSDLLPLS
mgnify:CR=1 FL=1